MYFFVVLIAFIVPDESISTLNECSQHSCGKNQSLEFNCHLKSLAPLELKKVSLVVKLQQYALDLVVFLRLYLIDVPIQLENW